MEIELWASELSEFDENSESGFNCGTLRISFLLIWGLNCCREILDCEELEFVNSLDWYLLEFISIYFLWFYFVRESILQVRILGWFWNLWLVSFLVLAAPLVQTAGRGRAQQRRGAYSTCKLILEMCASFLLLNLLNPHMIYNMLLSSLTWGETCMLDSFEVW